LFKVDLSQLFILGNLRTKVRKRFSNIGRKEKFLKNRKSDEFSLQSRGKSFPFDPEL